MAATASPNLNDSFLLAGDPTFQGRVKLSMLVNAISVRGNTNSSAAAIGFAIGVLNGTQQPSIQTMISIVAANSTVVSDATEVGTVPLTTANVSTQQALANDNDINAAVSADFSSFHS